MRALLTLVCCLAGSMALAGHELENRDLVTGQALYGNKCAVCHGVNLEGQEDWRSPDENGVLPAPPHDESGHTWHHDTATLFQYTKLGGAQTMQARGLPDFQSGMPGFSETLSDDEIFDVLAYIRSTWPERVQEMQQGRNQPHE